MADKMKHLFSTWSKLGVCGSSMDYLKDIEAICLVNKGGIGFLLYIFTLLRIKYGQRFSCSVEQWHPLPTHIGTQGQESTIDYTDRYMINIPNRSLLMSVSFQWGEQRCTPPPPPTPTPALLFTVPVWRLGELFQTTTAIALCSAADNFIINSGWDEQNLLQWPLVSAVLASIYDFVCTCCGSHRLYPRAVVARDLCVLKNFMWRLMYLGEREEKSMQIWCWCEGSWQEDVMKRERGEDDCCLTPKQSDNVKSKKKTKTTFLNCVWPNQLWVIDVISLWWKGAFVGCKI